MVLVSQPDNTTPAGTAQPDGHLGELATAVAVGLLLRHAAQALRLEHAAGRRAVTPIRTAAVELSRWAAKQWVTTAGGLDKPLDPIQWSGLQPNLVQRLRAVKPDPAPTLPLDVEKAYGLGTRQAYTALGLPRPRDVEPATLPLPDIGRVIDRRYATTERLLATQPIETWDQLALALAPTHAAASDVDRDARTAVNTAVNLAAHDVAVQVGADLLWVAEPDACFVASTRVLAPAVLVEAPGSAAGEVPGLPLDGLTTDPPSLDVALDRYPGALSAAAVARPVRDRFREVQAVSSREYVGDVVRIRTARGKDLTGTPNHPIATSRGWIPLGQLKVGDHVFSRTDSERVPLGVDPHDNDAPPTIEQVAEAFPVPVRVVPTAPEDFHGDGAGSDVHVVRADSLLLDQVHAARAEHGREIPLQRRDVRLAFLAGARLRFSRRIRSLAAAKLLGPLADGLLSLLGWEASEASQVPSRDQAVALEPPLHRQRVDAVDYGDFLGRLAGLVEPDEVVGVGGGEFRGQVFNLQTVEGWYLANDIAVHNCVVCLALAGTVVGVDEDFPADATFGDHPVDWWQPDHITGPLRPPRHPRCRCRCEAWLGHAGPPGSLTLPDALKREAQRSVLRGWSLPSESEQVRIRAADRLLKRGSGLPKTVRAYARRSVNAGRFPTRTLPTGKETA